MSLRDAPAVSIGRPQALVDGPEKVTGRARYAADYRSSDALVGAIFRSPVAHARFIRVVVSKYLKLP